MSNNMASSCSSLDNEVNPIKTETNKTRILPTNSCEILDELLEIQQIEYEQRLILEEINRIDIEKQRLQNLLNLLQSSKANDRKKPKKSRHRRFQNSDSSSDCD